MSAIINRSTQRFPSKSNENCASPAAPGVAISRATRITVLHAGVRLRGRDMAGKFRGLRPRPPTSTSAGPNPSMQGQLQQGPTKAEIGRAAIRGAYQNSGGGHKHKF